MRIKKVFTLLFAGALGFSSFDCAVAQDSWKEEKSTHFIVYYKYAPESFIRKLVERSEELYDSIANNLGFRRFDFWLWDNRAKIYVHDSAAEYRSATGQPAWSVGAAMMEEKTIHSFTGAKGFMETVLPHEMAHIIFREFVGLYNPAVPLWLDEGVASSQMKTESRVYASVIAAARAAGSFIDFGQLSSYTSGTLRNSGNAELFYAEAASLVAYLIREFGNEQFAVFCQDLHEKKDLASALAKVYPFSSPSELGKAWEESLGK